MNKTYLYEIYSGCGRTTLTLNINNDKFTGNYKSHWMGNDNMECKLEGRVNKNTDYIKMYGM